MDRRRNHHQTILIIFPIRRLVVPKSPDCLPLVLSTLFFFLPLKLCAFRVER